MKEVTRDSLLVAGVVNLKEFGYPTVNKENILTNYVFASFFMRMLKDNKGITPHIDKELKGLIAECEKTIAKGIKDPQQAKVKGKKK